MKPSETLAPSAAASLEDRGIDLEVASRMGVVSGQSEFPTDDRDWVSFPHINGDGRTHHWAFRTVGGEKGFQTSIGFKPIFWNQSAIKDQSLAIYPLVITEGHVDAMSMMTAGVPRVVSVPNGAPEKEIPIEEGKTKYAYLENCGIEDVKEIIIAVDNDNPGYALMQDLANRLGRSRCRWVSYPDGCKDANDVLLKYGSEKLKSLIDGAGWMKINGMYTLDELPPEPKEEIHTIGIPGLDDFWKISRGRMTLVTGIPGHGKTQAVTAALCELAEQGFVISIASFEDTPRGSLLDRLLRWKLRADPDYAAKDRLDAAIDWVREHFIFIYPDDESDEAPTVDWYLERVQAAVVRYNVFLAVVDPWNEMDHTVRNLEVSSTEYVGFMIAKMRRHAKRFRYHTVVVCHPRKMETGKDGKYQVPTGYSCADSAHFYNKPDVGITVYRDETEEGESFTQIGCWKAKLEGKIGVKGGKMTFRFDLRSGRYQAAPEFMNSKAT